MHIIAIMVSIGFAYQTNLTNYCNAEKQLNEKVFIFHLSIFENDYSNNIFASNVNSHKCWKLFLKLNKLNIRYHIISLIVWNSL